jgi:uncharacterized repeat protein (TIGR03803 family)
MAAAAGKEFGGNNDRRHLTPLIDPGGDFRDADTGCATMFSLDPNNGAESVLYFFCSRQNCTDGQNLHAGPIDENGALYGTTYAGGAYGCGAVFAIEKP